MNDETDDDEPKQLTDQQLRQKAVDEYALRSDGKVQIDEEPVISHADDGVWVAAWLFVPYG